MALKCVFLNWNRPLISLSALELLKLAKSESFFDLSHILAILSTAHATKKLSYELTKIANDRGSALLPPKFVTPQFFFTYQMSRKMPSETQRILFWIEAIKLNSEKVKFLFPDKLNETKNFAWYLDRAEKIIELVDTLATIGITIKKLVSANSDAIKDDMDRFIELSQIENTYFDLLNKAGFEDYNKIKIENALNPKPPNGISKIIFIAVPDPIPILTETINILSSFMDLEIWINAPIDFDLAFDTYGRPIYDFWKNKNLDIIDFKNQVTLFDSPGNLVTDFVNLLAEKKDLANEEISIGDISLIIPDISLEPALRHSFLKHNINTYNPSGINLNKTAPGALFCTMLEFILNQNYLSFANLIRNADFLAYIKLKIVNLDYSKLFSINDYLQNNYMPIAFEDMLKASEKENKKSDKYKDATSLNLYSKVLIIVKELLIEGREKAPAEFALSKIIEIYNLIKSDISHDFKEDSPTSIGAIKEIVFEVEKNFWIKFGYNDKDIALLTAKRIQDSILYPPQKNGTLPLRGWFELQWEEKKPYTFILGMNEGIVPSVTTNDMFIPDSLKKKLNLPCNDSRFARDFYILYSTIKNYSEYHLNFIVMKTNQKGEYLKPSRLLLQTSDKNHFYERLNYLFRGKSISFEHENNTITEMDKYPLTYNVPLIKLKENYLNVTDFKNYLKCPFRFYLKKVLGYEEEIDDTKTDINHRKFGIICHETLVLLGNKLKEKTDEKELRSVLAKKLTFEKSKFSPSIPVEFSFYSLQQRLNKALDVMLEEEKNGEWEINDLEKDFNLVLDSDKLEKWLGTQVEEEILFSIKGRIDRIDISRDGKNLRIIDYKTGNVSSSPKSEHYKIISARNDESHIKEYERFEIGGKQYKWIDLQLPLYAIILQELPEYKNIKIDSCAYFVIPKSVTDTKIIPWKNILQEELDAARKCASQIILNMAKSIFWPPSDKVKCDNYEKILYDTSFEKYISFGTNK